MPLFRALTSVGLVEPLAAELVGLDVGVKRQGVNWVEFETNWQGCYRVNTRSHVATRIILPILDFPAFTEDELYQKVLRHDFTQYIDPHQTLSVSSSLSNSNIRDQRVLALKVKDAVVDQFRDKFGRRPDVDRQHPDMRIFVRCVRNSVSLAIDTSGRNLSDRGYRLEAGLAPISEHLASGLLRLAGWQPEIPLLDPMCGSGTILIEAARWASNKPVQLYEQPFAFEKFKKFRETKFDREPLQSGVKKNLALFGSDRDGGLIQRAQRNTHRAQVSAHVSWSQRDFRTVFPPTETGMLIVNPPYGARLNDGENLERLYEDFAAHLKTHFKGWTMWLLSGNLELTKALRLKATKKFLVMNGDIECRFLCYPIS